jgi:hypothetical protein
MLTLRRILTSATLLIAATGIASADSIVTFTSSFSAEPTDITDQAIPMTPFVPGTDGVPLGAVLVSYDVAYTETISGLLTIQNTGTSLSTVKGTIDSLGLLYLFTSAAAHGDTPIDPANPPTDDAFGGAGPDPLFSVKAKLNPGQSTTPAPYTVPGGPADTGPIDTGLAAVESAWSAFASSATNVSSSATGSGNGKVTYSNEVAGSVSVTYDYVVPSGTPEPTTMFLMGGALVGLGLLGKRLKRS